MRVSRLTIMAAAAAFLSGCLVSDAPMFDAQSGSAAPLQPGRYQVCSETPEEGDECETLGVERREDGAYVFTVADEEEDSILVRFHEIDGTAYAAQFADDEGDGFQYYWGRRDGAAFLIGMIWCEDFPAAMREAMKADGLIAQEGSSATCTALKPAAVVEAAKAYRDGAVAIDSAIRLTRLSP